MNLIIIIILNSLFFKILRKKIYHHPYRIINPSFWLLVGWFFLISLHLFSGIKYTTKISFDVWLLVIIFIGSFVFGEFIGKKMVIRKKQYLVINNDINLFSSKFMPYVVFLCALLLISDIIILNGFPNGSRYINFTISTIGSIATLIASGGLILWLNDLVKFYIIKKKLSLFSFLSLLSYLSYGLLTAGRQSIFISGITSMIIIIWGVNREEKWSKVMKGIIHFLKYNISKAVILGLILFAYLYYISTHRQEINNKTVFFEYLFNAKFSDHMRIVLSNLSVFQDILIDILYYYSHQLHALTEIVQYYEGPVSFGSGQFSLVFRVLGKLGINFTPIISTFNVSEILISKGYYSGIWKTAILSMMVDFGVFGMIVQNFVLGLYSGKLLRKINYYITSLDICLLSLISAGAIFSVQYSPFSEISWMYPLLWCLLLRFGIRIQR